jgi:hypothetical protein
METQENIRLPKEATEVVTKVWELVKAQPMILVIVGAFMAVIGWILKVQKSTSIKK